MEEEQKEAEMPWSKKSGKEKVLERSGQRFQVSEKSNHIGNKK